MNKQKLIIVCLLAVITMFAQLSWATDQTAVVQSTAVVAVGDGTAVASEAADAAVPEVAAETAASSLGAAWGAVLMATLEALQVSWAAYWGAVSGENARVWQLILPGLILLLAGTRLTLSSKHHVLAALGSTVLIPAILVGLWFVAGIETLTSVNLITLNVVSILVSVGLGVIVLVNTIKKPATIGK